LCGETAGCEKCGQSQKKNSKFVERAVNQSSLPRLSRCLLEIIFKNAPVLSHTAMTRLLPLVPSRMPLQQMPAGRGCVVSKW
jgi:hypothetical protein